MYIFTIFHITLVPSGQSPFSPPPLPIVAPGQGGLKAHLQVAKYPLSAHITIIFNRLPVVTAHISTIDYFVFCLLSAYRLPQCGS